MNESMSKDEKSEKSVPHNENPNRAGARVRQSYSHKNSPASTYLN